MFCLDIQIYIATKCLGHTIRPNQTTSIRKVCFTYILKNHIVMVYKSILILTTLYQNMVRLVDLEFYTTSKNRPIRLTLASLWE